MIFGQDRNELRKMYVDAWAKRCENLPLSPLETQIADVIELHPEYHADVTGAGLEREYSPDGGQTNPFLHMVIVSVCQIRDMHAGGVATGRVVILRER